MRRQRTSVKLSSGVPVVVELNPSLVGREISVRCGTRTVVRQPHESLLAMLDRTAALHGTGLVMAVQYEDD
jgi:hypothetical protein